MRFSSFIQRLTLFCAFAAIMALPCASSIGLVVGEPFGSFGTMLPVGHAGIYLDHVCAATPTQLRPCRLDESGVIIARYHDLRDGNLDWMATPVIPFFYGVEDIAETPGYVTPSLKAEVRESYHQAHLLPIAPLRIDRHGNTRPARNGDWQESIGAAFDRRLLLYVIDSTPEQEAAIMARLNEQPNIRQYSLRRSNCADFAAGLLNIVLPGVFRRNLLADFDYMTPKQLARTLDSYGQTHPQVHLQVYEIPQLPGTLRRSRPLRGVAETFVKTKRYLATLLVLQPEAAFADWLLYEEKGRWTPGLDATRVFPSNWQPAWQPADLASGANAASPTPLALDGFLDQGLSPAAPSTKEPPTKALNLMY